MCIRQHNRPLWKSLFYLWIVLNWMSTLSAPWTSLGFPLTVLFFWYFLASSQYFRVNLIILQILMTFSLSQYSLHLVKSQKNFASVGDSLSLTINSMARSNVTAWSLTICLIFQPKLSLILQQMSHTRPFPCCFYLWTPPNPLNLFQITTLVYHKSQAYTCTLNLVQHTLCREQLLYFVPIFSR